LISGSELRKDSQQIEHPGEKKKEVNCQSATLKHNDDSAYMLNI
jgi:hypothetical protein